MTGKRETSLGESIETFSKIVYAFIETHDKSFPFSVKVGTYQSSASLKATVHFLFADYSFVHREESLYCMPFYDHNSVQRTWIECDVHKTQYAFILYSFSASSMTVFVFPLSTTYGTPLFSKTLNLIRAQIYILSTSSLVFIRGALCQKSVSTKRVFHRAGSHH